MRMRSWSQRRQMLATAGLLACLWWLLSGGAPSSWVIGIPAVLLGGWWLQRLRPAGSSALSISGLLVFVPFFIWQSLRGGLDVARRTLVPRMRIHPGLAVYAIRLQHPPARVFFVNCVSLLPGTLAAEITGDELTVHLLDDRADPAGELEHLEHAVSRIFPGSTRQETNRP